MHDREPVSRLIRPSEFDDCLRWGLARCEPSWTAEPPRSDRTLRQLLNCGDGQADQRSILAAGTFGPAGLQTLAIVRQVAGGSATVVLLASDERFEAARSTSDPLAGLLRPLLGRLRERGVTFLQASAVDTSQAERLRLCGFRRLAELSVLCLDPDDFTAAIATAQNARESIRKRRPVATWDWLPLNELAADGTERVATALAATFRQTLDCPRLGRLRTTDEIIRGFLHWPSLDREWSRLLRVDGQDIGCLLLSRHAVAEAKPIGVTEAKPIEHTEAEPIGAVETEPIEGSGPLMELSYLGITPAYRGQRWGFEVVAETLRVARLAGVTAVVLAVDRENAPAVAIYRFLGFRESERESVWGRRVSG